MNRKPDWPFGLMVASACLLLMVTFCDSPRAAEQDATNAAIADGASTAVALALGAAEANPLGAAFAVGVKLPLLAYARTLPEAERERFYAVAAPVWEGATANNLCVIAVLLSGGGAAPACLLVGLAWGFHASQVRVVPSEPVEAVEVGEVFGQEVAFWDACQTYKRQSGESFRCHYRRDE